MNNKPVIQCVPHPRILLALLALSWGIPTIRPPLHAATFTNPAPIHIPIGALPIPYPSLIPVSVGAAEITDVTATLLDVNHPFPDDLDVLLVGPKGQSVLLMSDAGGSNRIVNVDLTFSDAVRSALPDSAQIVSGTYRPSNYGTGDAFPAPAPTGPYGASLSVFNSTAPDGIWRLYVFDDASAEGVLIAGGWRLNLELTNYPPVIVQQPQSQTTTPGGTITFAVGVSGTPPFGYQWLHNGQVIVPFGQGSALLTVLNVQPSDAGTYSVVITNAAKPFPGVSSLDAVLNVEGPLAIVQPLPDQTAEPGGTVTFRIAAAGTPPLFYQWKLNGAILPGETNAALILGKLQATNGGRFSVVVFNATEAIASQPGVLSVLASMGPAPEDQFADRPVVKDPQGVLQGNSARAGTEPGEPAPPGGGKTVWFEWVPPDDGIATLTTRGSAFDTLMSVFTGNALDQLKFLTGDDDRGGFYTSRLQFNAHHGTAYQIALDGFGTNDAGGEFTLSWDLEPTNAQVPVIVAGPQPLSVPAGSNADFHVTLASTDSIYQWMFNGTPIPGGTGSAYSISNAQAANIGVYSVRLSNGWGRVVDSAPVQLQLASDFPNLTQDIYQKQQASGNRPAAGFISINLGGTVWSEGAVPPPGPPTACNNFWGPLPQLLHAGDDGTIEVDTGGSGIPARLAVYLGYHNFGDMPIACGAPDNPSTTRFLATLGTNYTVEADGYQTNGTILLTSRLGIAPALPEMPTDCLVSAGDSVSLQMPATSWIPLPSCQWLLNGTNIPNATNTSLLLTNFTAADAGVYSVVMSNFVAMATNTISRLTLAGPFLLDYAWVTNNGNVGFRIAASNSAPFVLQTCTNFGAPWLPLATNQDACSTLVYTHTNPILDSWRFFRAAPWPPP